MLRLGGDRYPGSRFLDHFLRYQDRTPQDSFGSGFLKHGVGQDDANAKMLLLLGEVGGVDEYDLIDARSPA